MEKSVLFLEHKKVLATYLPPEFVDSTVKLILQHPLEFQIVPPRTTKLGDFRVYSHRKLPKITINGDLNPYSFLVTTLHELAHYFTFLEYGIKVKAHGKEWQQKYRDLIYPTIQSGHLPKDVENALLESLINVKASSCTDLNLMRALGSYDPEQHDRIYLEDIKENTHFELNGKWFSKGKLRRKRYLCRELETGKDYLVSAVAQVKLKENGK